VNPACGTRRPNHRLGCMKLLLLAVALPMLAADPAGFRVWSASELLTRAKALELNQYRQGVDRMENWGNHAVILERLEGATPAEAHETMADLFVFTSGETTLTAGGVIVEPANASAGEIRGKSINGGTARKLGAGDIVHIPAKMPHQLSVEAGKQSTYLVIQGPDRVEAGGFDADAWCHSTDSSPGRSTCPVVWYG
jgi:mannose-6-phosphate isomerase-like protein (cupin superfamily)